VTRLKGIWAAFEADSIVIPELEQLGDILVSYAKALALLFIVDVTYSHYVFFTYDEH